MSLNATPVNTHADLGDAWRRHQTARLRQKHLQFGQHCRLDVDTLLARMAGASRMAQSAETPTVREPMPTDHIRRAMIEAIEHCAQLRTHPSARAAEVFVLSVKTASVSCPDRLRRHSADGR
jgi:hypothetical protein